MDATGVSGHESLDSDMQRQVSEAVIRLAETGYGDARKLKGTTGEYRLRVGIGTCASHTRARKIMLR